MVSDPTGEPRHRNAEGARAATRGRATSGFVLRRLLVLVVLTVGAASTVTAVVSRGFTADRAGWPGETPMVAVLTGAVAVVAGVVAARHGFLTPGSDLIVADVAVAVARLAVVCVLAFLIVMGLAAVGAPDWATGLPAMVVAAAALTPAVVLLVRRPPRP